MKNEKGKGGVSRMQGNRNRPFVVRIHEGYSLNHETGKASPVYKIIGYAKTRREGNKMLDAYHESPYSLETATCTFEDVFKLWSEEKFESGDTKKQKGYIAAFKAVPDLHRKSFKDLKSSDLQAALDKSQKQYPTLKNIKILYTQMYKYALKNDMVGKDYSQFVDIAKHARNYKQEERQIFSINEIKVLMKHANDIAVQVILILIFTGVRINELLNLKKENIHLEDQYLEVVESKTTNGIRKVPIADYIMPFILEMMNDTDSEYLIHHANGQQMKYERFNNKYFHPIMKSLKMKHRIHDTRHTCISLLVETNTSQTTIKKIVGHKGAMTLTERVYTHLDIHTLIQAINQIKPYIDDAK